MPKKIKKLKKKEKKYFKGIGRRKRATASVRLFKAENKNIQKIIINEKPDLEYFENNETASKIFLAPLFLTENLNNFDISIKVKGGGKKAQIEAIRQGIARALVLFDENLKQTLRKAGYLTRDPREKERKKPGLKGARKAPQWQKR